MKNASPPPRSRGEGFRESLINTSIIQKCNTGMKLTLKFVCLGLAAIACSRGKMQHDASGVFEATEVMVSSEVSGKLQSFTIAEGQQLDSAQAVGQVDSTQLHLQKMQLQARIKATQSKHMDVATQVAATEQQIATAKTEQRRFKNLLQVNAATQKQFDDINAQVAVLERQLAAQKTNLESANSGITDEVAALNAQRDQLSDQLRKTSITAPIAGTVLAKYAETGELVSQGRPLFKVADLRRIMLRAYITSGQLTQVKIGQEVKVFADFGEKESREYAGTIAWISDKAEFTPKTIQTRDERANLVYAVKIAVANDGYIKMGMYGDVRF